MRLTRGHGAAVETTAPPARRTVSPVLSCTAWGFSCPGTRAPGGGLLPRHFTLAAAASRLRWRYVFCDTFRRRELAPPAAWVCHPARCLAVSGLSSDGGSRPARSHPGPVRNRTLPPSRPGESDFSTHAQPPSRRSRGSSPDAPVRSPRFNRTRRTPRRKLNHGPVLRHHRNRLGDPPSRPHSRLSCSFASFLSKSRRRKQFPTAPGWAGRSGISS